MTNIKELIYMMFNLQIFIFFFFNDTSTSEIYTLSLHDALPISTFGKLSGNLKLNEPSSHFAVGRLPIVTLNSRSEDRKSTRLNSSHTVISYAVFCLKKKK